MKTLNISKSIEDVPRPPFNEWMRELGVSSMYSKRTDEPTANVFDTNKFTKLLEKKELTKQN